MEEIVIDNATFLVAFHGLSIKGNFIFNTAQQLSHLINKHNKYGIDSIKELDIKDLRFKRVSKIRLRTLWGWDTECIELLKQLKYI